jgi:hypothetical protein
VQRFLNEKNKNISSQIYNNQNFDDYFGISFVVNPPLPILSMSHEQEINNYKRHYSDIQILIRNTIDGRTTENRGEFHMIYRVTNRSQLSFPDLDDVPSRDKIFTLLVDEDDPPIFRQRAMVVTQAFEEAIVYLLQLRSKSDDMIPLLRPLSALTNFEAQPPEPEPESDDEESRPQRPRTEGLTQALRLDALNFVAQNQMMGLPQGFRGSHDATPRQMLAAVRSNLGIE